MIEEVRLAFEEVRKYHAQVTHVFYSDRGTWFFSDAYFEAPAFNPMIDAGILEDAADAVYDKVGYPAAFSFDDG